MKYRNMLSIFVFCALFISLNSIFTLLAQEEKALNSAPAMCRYGASPLGSSQYDWLSSLGAGWYVNFSANPYVQPTPEGIEFAHVIRVNQDKTPQGGYLSTYTTSPPLSSLDSLISNNPGAIWLVGNEVDRGPNPGEIDGGQDDTYPSVYARAYHDVYHYIKDRDPSARIANSALVQVTPGRLQYLDLMWQAYLDEFGTSMPVDIWNMHLYILPEVNPSGEANGIASVALGTNPALAKRESGGIASQCNLDNVYCFAEHDDMVIFEEQVIAMRQWMKDHGQQQKPLILSEFSILYIWDGNPPGSCFVQDEYGNCFTPARVTNFLQATFDYLRTRKDPALGYALDENRLIQQSLWFAVNSAGVGSSSNLVNDSLTQLTQVGQAFSDYVFDQPLEENLVVEQAATVVAFTGGAPTVDVEISVKFRNNGNIKITDAHDIRFYATADIGTVNVNSILEGCTVEAQEVTTTWSGLAPGKYDYWVELDDGDNINETNENDNIGHGIVLVDPDQTFFPLIGR